ncbi:MAG: hypothetical protein ACOX02_05020 [Acholeplasmatales bacterium]
MVIDYVILGFVLIIIGLIIYFRWIKKNKNKTECNCYKSKNCNVKLEELRKLFEHET